jgi:hypothetical protein
MMGGGQGEQKALLDRMRMIYNDLKVTYVDFLSSLRYDNLAERKKVRNRVKRQEEIEGDEGW